MKHWVGFLFLLFLLGLLVSVSSAVPVKGAAAAPRLVVFESFYLPT